MQYLDVRPLNTCNAILKYKTLDNMNDTVKSELKHVCMRTHFCKTKSIMMIDDAAMYNVANEWAKKNIMKDPCSKIEIKLN